MTCRLTNPSLIYALDDDFVTQSALEDCNAIRAEANLPPLGSDCDFVDPLEDGYYVFPPYTFCLLPIDMLNMQIDKAAYDQGRAPDFNSIPEAELRRMVDGLTVRSAPKYALKSATWHDGAKAIRERLRELPFALV